MNLNSRTLTWGAVTALLATALIHFVEAPAAFTEATYTGLLFVANGVGAMVAVAHGTCTPAELAAALRGEESSAGMQQAPAHGLCLEHILHTPSPGWIRRTMMSDDVR